MVKRTTPDSLTRRTVALVLILVTIAIVLTWATWYETVSDRREIERLMATYVQSIGDVISESGAHGMPRPDPAAEIDPFNDVEAGAGELGLLA
jgi:hypothetical protein